ncbi:hypothetical protein SISNIDRAFT_486167 [Sistotremastrum niveocremeum HHB9708]|uniref:C4-dicarboxylate transporter/malic acid transport protein n=1 Tax=Sistotremastrum niveocremeum HHB9708 TaxID=1314777 RepID=A0A164TUJ6_9AGAM|nr:hypothetical protein SISNIDRAFT_486167 [Sistotremastrum niveocremeum HHB9708]
MSVASSSEARPQWVSNTPSSGGPLPGLSYGYPGKQAMPWRERIRNFTPAWFYVTMGLAITTLQFMVIPWHHELLVLKVIFLIFWLTTLLVIFAFLGLTIARYVMFPDLWQKVWDHPDEAMYFACLPMSLIPMQNGMSEGLDLWWGLGGHNSARFLWFIFGCWLATTLLGYTIAFVCFKKMITVHRHEMKTMTAAWLAPFGALIVDGSAGTLMTPLLAEHNPSIGMFAGLWATMTVSIGLSVSVLVMAILLQRMFVDGLPPAKHIWTSWSVLSVTTQAGFTILALSGAFNALLPVHYGTSKLLTHPAIGEIIYAIGITIGMVLWFVSIFAIIFAIFAVWTVSKQEGLIFGPNCWAWVFPFGVFAVHTYGNGLYFDSQFFRVLGGILNIITILGSSVMIVLTVPQFFRGTMFTYSYVVDDEAMGIQYSHKQTDAARSIWAEEKGDMSLN